MVHVVFDTSALRHAGTLAIMERHLAPLVDQGLLELHVPELALSELVTGLSEEVKSNLKKVRDLKSVVGWFPTSSERNQLEAALSLAQAPRQQLSELLQGGVDDWARKYKVVIDPLSGARVDAVFKNYFAGSAPFGEPKARQDIPDGFVFDAVQRLTERAPSEWVAIVHDGRLGKAIASLRITVFPSLADFIQSTMFIELTPADVAWLENARYVVSMRHGHVKDLIMDAISSAATGREIEGILLSDDDRGAIDVLQDIELTNVGVDQATHTGPNTLSVQVSGIAHASVEVIVHKSKYYSGELEDVGATVLDHDWSSQFVQAEIEVPVTFEAAVDILYEESDGGPLELEAVDLLDLTIVPSENA